MYSPRMRDSSLRQKTIMGVSPNVFFLGLVSFFNDFSAEMVQSVMPAFLRTVLGVPVFLISFLEGFADALASVLKVFSGWFSDVLQKRKLPAVVGYVLSVGVRPLFAAAAHFSEIFALRAVDRIGKGLRDAPRDALIVESSRPEALAHAFGVHRSLDTLGATVGPLFAFAALPLLGYDYRAIFVIAFAVGIGALLSFFFVKETKRADAAPASPRPLPLRWKIFIEQRRFFLVVGSVFVFGLGTLPLSLILLTTQDIGISLAAMPLMYFFYSLTFVFTAIPLGKVADRFGMRRVIAAGFLVACAAYAGFAYAGSFASLAACFVALGIYAAATDGVQRAFASTFLAKEVLATGQGFLNMAIGLSSLGASIAGGLLWQIYAPQYAFLYAAAMSVVGAVLFFVMTGKTKNA